MITLPTNITSLSLTSRWWKQPPDWFCIVTKVDDNFQRVKPITVEAPTSTEAVNQALALAEAYEFETVVYVAQTPLLDLEIDI